jgi:pyruvate dehydrogenase E2 component (dihydrolipoamide acetyltransferase)
MSENGDLRLSPHGIPVAKVIPLRGVIKMLADHMMRSHLGYAAYTVMGEVDLKAFEAFRKELVHKVEEERGVHISFTHLIVKVIAQSILGVAVALETGMLVVPVIKAADKKSILEIAERGIELAEKARTNKLGLDDVTGGTFTLSNAGMFGRSSEAGYSTPIITEPQSAILGLSASYEKPVVRNGEIVISRVLPTSLTIDHRVINGVPAAQFMGTFNSLLENPDQIDLGI